MIFDCYSTYPSKFQKYFNTPRQKYVSCLPNHRCGHLACGTYCSLSAGPYPRPPLRLFDPIEKIKHDRSQFGFEKSDEEILPAKGKIETKIQETPRFPEFTPRFVKEEKGDETTKKVVDKMMEQTIEKSKTGREEITTTKVYGRDYLWNVEGIKDEVTVRPKDGLTLDDGSWKHPLLTTDELNQRLQQNPKYLMQRICRELLRIDRWGRGIISASIFSQLLHRLGAHPPTKEISELLKYCLITNDGFVIYKPLLMLVMPEKTSKNRDNVKYHLSPPEVWNQDIYHPARPKDCPIEVNDGKNLKKENSVEKELRRLGFAKHSEQAPEWIFEIKRDPMTAYGWSSELSDSVRRLFAMWDRNLINDEKVKYHLKLLGIPITFEAECLLSLYGPSRSLSFGRFLQALRINDMTAGRKLRTVIPQISECQAQEIPTRFSARLAAEADRDPIGWKPREWPSVLEKKKRGQAVTCPWAESETPVSKDTELLNVSANRKKRQKLHGLLIEAVDGHLDSSTVKAILDTEGIVISIEMDKLVSEIDIEGGGKLGPLISALSRCKGWPK